MIYSKNFHLLKNITNIFRYIEKHGLHYRMTITKKNKKNRIFFKRINNQNYFSLNKYIQSQLKALNIKKIDIINKDTFNPKNNFFSARRSIGRKENDYGRNISVIMIN